MKNRGAFLTGTESSTVVLVAIAGVHVHVVATAAVITGVVAHVAAGWDALRLVVVSHRVAAVARLVVVAVAVVVDVVVSVVVVVVVVSVVAATVVA